MFFFLFFLQGEDISSLRTLYFNKIFLSHRMISLSSFFIGEPRFSPPFGGGQGGGLFKLSHFDTISLVPHEITQYDKSLSKSFTFTLSDFDTISLFVR